jgi:TRAP-type mannitol/chloroaromatic compound transport system substrate-binding protein
MDRRKFVKTAGVAGLAGTAGLLSACGGKTGASDCAESTAGPAAEAIEWKMVTTWPRDFPGLGTGATHLADLIGKLSNGRLKVKVYGGNELVPPFEVFDAVQRGTAVLGHGGAYYWKGKIPASQFLGGWPFGLTGNEMNGWFYHGGGLEIYHEAYAPSGLIPFPVGNSGTQMGGWFNKEINSVADLTGLKMRIPGVGAEVLKRIGGTPVNIPGAELHEPGSALEGIVNAEAWASLAPDLQQIVETACKAASMDMYADFEARNGTALNTLINEHQVELRAFPDEVLDELKRVSFEVLEELAAADEMSGKVWASFKAYFDTIRGWTEIGSQYFLNRR